MRKLSLGSVQYFWQGRIESVTDQQNRTMTAKLTMQYDYENPTIHNVLTCERPPIPGKEKENSVFSMVLTRTLNPSIHQVISEYQVEWGTKSTPTQQTIKVRGEIVLSDH